jgi:anion-transporting  ArsA/GET3 family ATPase
MFLRPAGIGGRVIGAGTGMVFSVLRKVTGVDLLDELSVFFRALGGIIGDIVERAARVKVLLKDPQTTFLLVTSPERDPVEETIYFHRRLREQRLPFGGVIVNRMRDAEVGDGVEGLDDADLADRVLAAAQDLATLADRDRGSVAHLRRALADAQMIVVPQLPGDVHDLEGLAHVCEHLFGAALDRRAAAPA